MISRTGRHSLHEGPTPPLIPVAVLYIYIYSAVSQPDNDKNVSSVQRPQQRQQQRRQCRAWRKAERRSSKMNVGDRTSGRGRVTILHDSVNAHTVVLRYSS